MTDFIKGKYKLKTGEKVWLNHCSLNREVEVDVAFFNGTDIVQFVCEELGKVASLFDPVIIRRKIGEEISIFSCDIIEKNEDRNIKIKIIEADVFKERRKHPRYLISSKGVITDITSAKFVLVKDISLLGICVYASDVLPEHKEIDINILIGENESIELRGKVIWSKNRCEEEFTLQFEYGIEFGRYNKKEKMKELDLFIQKLEKEKHE